MGIHHSPSSHPTTAVTTTTTDVDNPISAVNQPPNHTTTPHPPSDHPSKPQINGYKPHRKPKKRTQFDDSNCASSSSSSSIPHLNNNHSHSPQKGIRIPSRRKIPKFIFRRNCSDVDAIAFPLGMSIAAVLSQVLERKDLTSEHASVDYLSMFSCEGILNQCKPALQPIAGSLCQDVFGDKFDDFARNFGKSFGSTLSTIRLIRSSNVDYVGIRDCNVNISDCHSRTTPTISSFRGEYSSRSADIAEGCRESGKLAVEASNDLKADDIEKESAQSMNRQLSFPQLGSWELARPEQRNSSSHSMMLNTIEKSVFEQTRANELKSLEIGLIMKKLQLKETQLALDSDSNFLERWKISLGISRASFKAEKFKNQLEETKHGELLRTCADMLIADLMIMSFFLGYGVYVFSSDKVRHLTVSCSPSEDSKSWWRPMASINSSWQTLSCQVQIYSRIIFGVSIFLAIGFLLVQRAGISRPVMPITFLILLLGLICGGLGKFCVDTVGGDGYVWLMYWEVMCILHFFANVFTRLLYYMLHGTVQVSPNNKNRSFFPFWVRQVLFYLLLLVVPICCGLLPFASPSTWWEDHFSKLIRNYMLPAYDEPYGDGSDLP